MKNEHYRQERLQDQYEKFGASCPADMCDIFECPELSEKSLRLQVFTKRSHNYEGKPDPRDGTPTAERKKRNRNYKNLGDGILNMPPYRYEMVQFYDKSRKAGLLQYCHRTFMDCVDYSQSESLDKIHRALDFFSQIFCQKFEEGNLDDMEVERNDRNKNLGLYKMIEDIHDMDYHTPLSSLQHYKV